MNYRSYAPARHTGMLIRTICLAVAWLVLPVLPGCATHSFATYRRNGQVAMLEGSYGSARYLFKEAELLRPRSVENLHDLGACSVILAREKFKQMNHAAAMRELDDAIAYYSESLEVHPGHQASIEGLNVALELKGQFDEALKHAERAAKFVGPSAKQYIFLGRELEERGDYDGAFLRYRQAVAMEPGNARAHIAMAKFLLTRHNERAAVYHLQAAYRIEPRNEWVGEQLAQRGAVPPLAAQKASTP